MIHQYLITLNIPNDQQKQNVVNLLKGLGEWARISNNNNVWILRTGTASVTELRDTLSVNAQSEDVIFVVEIDSPSWASLNLSPEVVAWLKKYQK